MPRTKHSSLFLKQKSKKALTTDPEKIQKKAKKRRGLYQTAIKVGHDIYQNDTHLNDNKNKNTWVNRIKTVTIVIRLSVIRPSVIF